MTMSRQPMQGHAQREPYVAHDGFSAPPLINQMAQERASREQYQNYEQEAPAQPLSASMFDMLWPIGFWSLMLYNLVLMATTSASMIGNYNWMTHAQVAGIGVLSMFGLAVTYKWILMGPDGAPRPQMAPAVAQLSPPHS